MNEQLNAWLSRLGVPNEPYYSVLAAALLVLVASLLLHWVLHRVVLQVLARGQAHDRKGWSRTLLGHHLFSRLALVFQGVVAVTLARSMLVPDSVLLALIEIVAHLWIILFSLLALFSMLDTVEEMSQRAGSRIKLPLRGIFQSLKLVSTTVAIIFAAALLIGQSPALLFSGLGAMTAVLLLIFKDPILGLVAGIQLSANNMLSVGDWMEMPDYGANGTVIDINLTTVKVLNFDMTVTSVPSYALISDSFVNWRNIEQVRGRRIKRAINIDATSVNFVAEEDVERLAELPLLRKHIDRKREELDLANRQREASSQPSGIERKMTNLGLFRAYLEAYLASSEQLNHSLTRMVRQLEAGPYGIPLELYAFARETEWVGYENIQSDLMDHVYATVAHFGLRLHQAPSAHDVGDLGRALQATPGS